MCWRIKKVSLWSCLTPCLTSCVILPAARHRRPKRQRSGTSQTGQGQPAARQKTGQTSSAASRQGNSAPQAWPHHQQDGHAQPQQWREQQQHQQQQQADVQSTAGWQQVRRQLLSWHQFGRQTPRRRLQQLAAQTESGSNQQAAVGQAMEAPQNVAMLTAIPPTPCKAPLADLINSLSLANKVHSQQRICTSLYDAMCCVSGLNFQMARHAAGHSAWAMTAQSRGTVLKKMDCAAADSWQRIYLQVDYARMHGYELHFSVSNIEANATVRTSRRLFSSCPSVAPS